jgi:hypothetical protein
MWLNKKKKKKKKKKKNPLNRLTIFFFYNCNWYIT